MFKFVVCNQLIIAANIILFSLSSKSRACRIISYTAAFIYYSESYGSRITFVWFFL